MRKNRSSFLNTFLYVFALLNVSISLAQYPVVKEGIINLPNFDKKTIHFGYFLGSNTYDFKFEYIPTYYKDLQYKDVAVEQKKGFLVGILADLRINEYFN